MDYPRIISTMVITSVGVVSIAIFTEVSVAYTILTVRTISIFYVITRACMVFITIITDCLLSYLK